MPFHGRNFPRFCYLNLIKFTFSMGGHVVVPVKTFPLMYQLPMCEWYWRSKGDFGYSAQVKIQVKIKFKTFLKKIQIFGFLCCSTREDLTIDVSIANVRLILTKLRWFRLFSTSQNTSQNSISNFFEKNSNFWVSIL